MSNTNLCFGCMEQKNGDRVCTQCGYDENSAVPRNALAPGSVLRERYLVGRMLEQNGEGMTYLAYDTNIGCKVLIREYLPEELCERVKDSSLVNVAYDHLAQYKSLMAEYTELNKALARQRSLVHLNPALDLFAENNTTYAVCEYLDGRNLLDYLKENAGELSWRTVSRMFPPLFTTLSIMHNAGVLHRGISPETVFVTDKGDIKLNGFCISAVRTNDTELEAELFDGYAAPEQYFANRQQGTWTDVYGICAVLYRILTGCRPTDANTRQSYDNLIPPCELNSRIPRHVSDAIMRGLELDGNRRVRTITDLVTLLFETNEDLDTPVISQHMSATTTFRTVSAAGSAQRSGNRSGGQQNGAAVRRSSGSSASAKKSTGSTKSRPAPVAPAKEGTSVMDVMEMMRVPLLIAILVALILGIVLMFFKDNIFGNNEQPLSSMPMQGNSNVVLETAATSTEQHYDSFVPNLIGMNYQIKKDQLAGWLELEPQYEYNDNVAKDVIFEQELPERAGFSRGSSMVVKVSLGSARKALPDFNGYTLEAYLTRLEEMGFVAGMEDTGYNKYTNPYSTTTAETTALDPGSVLQKVIYRPKVDYKFSNGTVCAIEPGVGTSIDVRENYTIIVYFAENPASTRSTKTTKKTDTTKTTSKKDDNSDDEKTDKSDKTKKTDEKPNDDENSKTPERETKTTVKPPENSEPTKPKTDQQKPAEHAGEEV